MSERLTSKPANIEKGCLVKIVDSTVQQALNTLGKPTPNVAYRVLGVTLATSNRFIFLGPDTLSPKDVDEFDPKETDWLTDERYREVFTIPLDTVKRILHS